LPGAHAVPQAPQFALSVASLAQYDDPPSGAQSVSPPPQDVVQPPSEQTVPAPQLRPQAPQFALSLSSFAQYEVPPSTEQVVSPEPQVVPHE